MKTIYKVIVYLRLLHFAAKLERQGESTPVSNRSCGSAALLATWSKNRFWMTVLLVLLSLGSLVALNFWWGQLDHAQFVFGAAACSLLYSSIILSFKIRQLKKNRRLWQHVYILCFAYDGGSARISNWAIEFLRPEYSKGDEY